MGLTRLLSIVFYVLIAAVTCVMAYSVDYSDNLIYVSGYPTRKTIVNKTLTVGIFTVLFIISALRFDIGNDYFTYTQTAHEASVGGYVVTEAGFNMLTRLVYKILGGEYYEAVFAIFAFVTLIIFIKGIKRLAVSFFDTFFLFMMLGVYFQTFNTVRYYLALAVAFYSMRYVLERDWIKFVFVILLAALFHKSVLIVIPVYFIASIGWRKWQIILGVTISVICYLCKGVMLNLALYLYPSYRDTIYLSGGTSYTSVARIMAAVALYGWFCYYYGHNSLDGYRQEGWYRELRLYGQLNMIALVASTIFSFLPVVTRLVYYFSICQILMIPLIVSRIEEVGLKRKIRNAIGVLALAYFMLFLYTAHRDGIGLLPYRSWLFETERYTF